VGLRNWTPKIALLSFLGWGITVLFLISMTKFWRHDPKSAIWYLALGAALTLIFFRNRKIAFAITTLSFLVVNVGLAALFHPTAARLLVTFSSVAAMYALAVWGAKKYPQLKRKDWKTLFDRDPE
jgi:glucose-6-phosphate-specific signal transduction histidine kinase